jgi:hypothetical protein
MRCIASIPESRMPSQATKESLAGYRGVEGFLPPTDVVIGLGIVYVLVT